MMGNQKISQAPIKTCRQIQRNTLCPVSVPILTQKSATYLRKLLILIEFRTFAERARFELAVWCDIADAAGFRPHPFST